MLNIAMHEPHSPDAYVSLFRALFQSRMVVNVRKVTGAMIGSMQPLNRERPTEGLVGEFYQFVNLDRDEPWFDLNKLEEAKEKDVETIHIPDHLKPHLARFTYVFFPEGHRLYLQTRNKDRTFGIEAARKFIKSLIALAAVEFPTVEVTVEPDKDSLNKILRMKSLTRLEITLLRPNPDDLQEAEKRLLARLTGQNAKKLKLTLQADSGEVLKPDEDTVTIAEVARSNGQVVAKGKDALGNTIERSTREHPWIGTAQFEEDMQLEQDAILAKAADMHATFRE
ncbi:DUF4747 domain-containing protein [Xanthomonas citri pv. citri]|nr:DUF4747 domain-containing protein [Xanthomonas citri pv. citri]ARR22529.1 DUF4747 domain-containing protein [Xanthomonas citri pv. citri]